MKICRCCQRQARITECRDIRPWVLPYLYGLVAEHECGGTLAFILWELSDEQLLIDDQLVVTSSERDSRETEAA
jgi:hypothetical protein